MARASKIAFFIIAGIGLSISATAAVSSYKKKKEEEAMNERQKFINAMKEKYSEIKNFNDFYEGVKYMDYPTVFGYDLRLFKNIENLSEILTFNELKLIYDFAKVGIAKKTEEENNKFLELMNKIF